jgi:membrane carboxypeptidase/penicillin-binding protein
LYNSPTPIIEVRNAKDEIIYKPTTKGTKALSEEVAFLISDILSDNGARSAVFGTNSLLNISGYEVAVKTGTTDDKRDNYAIGYTPSIVAGVWVGNNNNEAMNPYVASGISGASPIWNKFMTEYLRDKENEEFEEPENVYKVAVDELTGGLPYEDFPTREEWFIKGTEPTAKSDWYMRLEICKVDNLITNEDKSRT